MASGFGNFSGFNFNQAFSSLSDGIVGFSGYVVKFFSQSKEKEWKKDSSSQASSDLSSKSDSPRNSDKGGLEVKPDTKYEFGPRRPGLSPPVVLSTSAPGEIDRNMGWKSFFEETAMEKLKTKSQEHFSGMNPAQIQEKLKEISPRFKKSRKVYQEEDNQPLIDSAFDLLFEILVDPSKNIVKNSNIIEIADMVIDFDKSTTPTIDDRQQTQIQKNLKLLAGVLERRLPTVLERRLPPQEDEESSASIGPDKSPIQISSAPSAIIMPEDDVPSMPVGGRLKTQMSSLSKGVPNYDIKQGLRESSSEHLKNLFNEFQSQESEFMPYYGGLKGKDMFLNVAVEKIQSALRSPGNGDRVKIALNSLHLGYGKKAVEELVGLSEATKALIIKSSKNELSDIDKEIIKGELRSSLKLFQKLEDAGVYLLRDKPKDLDLAPQTRMQISKSTDKLYKDQIIGCNVLQ